MARLSKAARDRKRRFEALPPDVRSWLESARPWFNVEGEIVEKVINLLTLPAKLPTPDTAAELFTPDGAAALPGVEVSGDVLSRAIAAGTIPAIPVYGTSGTRVCHAITEAAARSVKRKRARAGEARAKAAPQD